MVRAATAWQVAEYADSGRIIRYETRLNPVKTAAARKAQITRALRAMIRQHPGASRYEVEVS